MNHDTVFDYDAGFQGYNLFVYCGNNPVNRIDISGADSRDMADGDKEEELADGPGGDGKINPPALPAPTSAGNSGSSGGGATSKITSIPQQAYDVHDYVTTHNGSPPQGYKGGRIFANDGRGGGERLPSDGTIYYEYDIHPYTKGVPRGKERIVIGTNGKALYTNDHYQTFIRMI